MQADLFVQRKEILNVAAVRKIFSHRGGLPLSLSLCTFYTRLARPIYIHMKHFIRRVIDICMRVYVIRACMYAEKKSIEKEG